MPESVYPASLTVPFNGNHAVTDRAALLGHLTDQMQLLQKEELDSTNYCSTMHSRLLHQSKQCRYTKHSREDRLSFQST
jgi:hypothetical protein